jgi:hypothetical protein
LTVTPEFVKDPEKFHTICSAIAGTNFLRMPPTFECTDRGNMFSTGLPIWIDSSKWYSFAKWILMYLERAAWVHYTCKVSSGQSFPKDFKNL